MKSEDVHMELVDRYLSGQATSEEGEQLEQLMLENPQLRSDFLAYARIDAALPGAVGGDAELIEFNPNPVGISKKGNWLVWGPIAAAAVLLIGLFLGSGLLQNGSSDSSQVVARFGGLSDCRWVDAAKQIESGQRIKVGERLELSSGIAEVIFDTGARLELTGPTIIEIRSSNGGFLTMGEVHLVAETPESKGFTLETPISKFIDIGTAFTATVSPDGLSRLDVTEGEVDVIVDENVGPRRITAGQTMYVEPGERKIVTRLEAGDETPAFIFPTISPPSNSDYADVANGKASIRAIHRELEGSSLGGGPVSVLIDGEGQSKQDSPRQSAFFSSHWKGNYFLMDLGKPISISRINSYSWHQHNDIEEHRERARQRFTLYGFAGDEPPAVGNHGKTGWTRIARVNSDKLFHVNERLDRPAQQGCEISATSGDLGRFRYLLWHVKGSTFFGEFDVHGAP